MKQLAIIGSTASGKSDLALSLALAHNAVIFSIDSLSIYQEIDIASAKPSKEERDAILHFGIDTLSPDQNASVFTFIEEYHRALAYALEHQKNIVIVGGSSFYLKSMLDGLSYIPTISDTTRERANIMLQDIESTHTFLADIDPITMAKIQSTDRYRIEKMLHLYLQTSTPPSEWFSAHPPKPVIETCPVLELAVERTVLRERIALRTEKMFHMGLIDEVAYLEHSYGRLPNSMKAIGIIETLEYLDGKISKAVLKEQIATHTAQLAKRQQTFNTHQFTLTASATADQLEEIGKKILQ